MEILNRKVPMRVCDFNAEFRLSSFNIQAQSVPSHVEQSSQLFSQFQLLKLNVTEMGLYPYFLDRQVNIKKLITQFRQLKNEQLWEEAALI